MTIPAGIDVRGFREDDSYAIDIATPRPAPKVAAGKPEAKADSKSDPKADPKARPTTADASPETPARPLVGGRHVPRRLRPLSLRRRRRPP